MRKILPYVGILSTLAMSGLAASAVAATPQGGTAEEVVVTAERANNNLTVEIGMIQKSTTTIAMDSLTTTTAFANGAASDSKHLEHPTGMYASIGIDGMYGKWEARWATMSGETKATSSLTSDSNQTGTSLVANHPSLPSYTTGSATTNGTDAVLTLTSAANLPVEKVSGKTDYDNIALNYGIYLGGSDRVSFSGTMGYGHNKGKTEHVYDTGFGGATATGTQSLAGSSTVKKTFDTKTHSLTIAPMADYIFYSSDTMAFGASMQYYNRVVVDGKSTEETVSTSDVSYKATSGAAARTTPSKTQSRTAYNSRFDHNNLILGGIYFDYGFSGFVGRISLRQEAVETTNDTTPNDNAFGLTAANVISASGTFSF